MKINRINSYQQNQQIFEVVVPKNCQTKAMPSFRRFSPKRQGWPGWRRAAEEALAGAPSGALILGIGMVMEYDGMVEGAQEC